MKKLKLKEVSEIYGGYAFKSKDFGVGENLVVKIKDIKPPIIDVENADKVDVSKYSTQKLEKFKVFPDDIVIAMTGATIGKVGRNKSGRTVFLNQRVAKINPNFKEDLDFIYYCINNTVFLEYVLNNVDSKSAQANISHFGIGNFEINWYDRETRQKIAKVLTCLDDKIFINSQINQELEVMAKTLYDYWFVQFDFPDQNGKPYKSSGGKMVYHPELKREIPEGWGVETLRDFESKIITGKTPSRANSDNFGGEIPFITIGDIRGNTFIYSTSESLTDLGASVQQNKYLPEGSLCVSCIATVGEIGFTTEWSHTNQQINSIVFEDKTHRYYLYFALKNYFENAKASAKTGNTFANMNKEDFSGIRIILPSKEIKNNFHEISEPYFAQIKCLQGQNRELTQLRDWLLPMLMNGQVKVE